MLVSRSLDLNAQISLSTEWLHRSKHGGFKPKTSCRSASSRIWCGCGNGPRKGKLGLPIRSTVLEGEGMGMWRGRGVGGLRGS